jgi:hypothetical protein
MQQATVLCLKTSWLQCTHLLEMCKREPEVGHGRFSCNYHWCFSLVRVSVTLPKRSENMDMWRLNRNITCSVNSFIRMRKYSIIQSTLVEALMQKSIHPKKTGLLKNTFACGKESKYSEANFDNLQKLTITTTLDRESRGRNNHRCRM